jgi:hypothetical protein
MSRNENSGPIDLAALIRQASARVANDAAPASVRSAPAERLPPARPAVACDPLAVVPNDLYLLVTRDPMGMPAAVVPRDSSHAVEIEDRNTPVPGRRTRLVVTLALTAAAIATAAIAFSRPKESSAPVAAPAAITKPAEVPAGITSAPRGLTASLPAPKDVRKKTTARPSGARIAPSLPADEAEPPTEPVLDEPNAEPEAHAAKEPEVTPPSPAAEPLDAAMRASVDPRAQHLGSAAGPTIGPSRPALGAVTAGLRAVLPAARMCLRPHDAVRGGNVVFASDGTVASVKIGGASTEDDCVRAALAKAKIPPFREASFSARVTVRP